MTFALYGRSLDQPFTSCDYQYLYGAQKLEGSRLIDLFRPAVQGEVLPPFYRPTSIVYFLGLYRVFGLAPVAFHGALLLIRVATLGVALLLFARLFRHPGWGAVAAALLAVNPFGIEPGVWPGAIPDSLLGLFLLGSLLCFEQLGRVEARGAGMERAPRALHLTASLWLAAVVLMGVLALASKEPAVVLPLLLACLPGRRRPRGRAAILALLIADALYVGLRLWMHANLAVPEGYDYWRNLSNPREGWWWTTVLLGCGQLITGPLSPAAMSVGVALLVAAAVLVGRSYRVLPWHGLALALLLLLPLAVTSGLNSPRYGYVPAMGVCLLVTALARLGWRYRARWLAAPLLAGWFALHLGYTHLWLGEWQRTGHASETVAQFLVTRPAEEETVLLWSPGAGYNCYYDTLFCTSYALNDAIYPHWIKEIAGNGGRALPLVLADGLMASLPQTECLEEDVVELRSERHTFRLGLPSIYTGRVAPDMSTCVEVLAADPTRCRFRLKRAPNRAFFTLTEEGWKQI